MPHGHIHISTEALFVVGLFIIPSVCVLLYARRRPKEDYRIALGPMPNARPAADPPDDPLGVTTGGIQCT